MMMSCVVPTFTATRKASSRLVEGPRLADLRLHVLHAAGDRDHRILIGLVLGLSLAAGVAGIAAIAILVNALFMQSGPHPAPIFANKPAPPPVISNSLSDTQPVFDAIVQFETVI